MKNLIKLKTLTLTAVLLASTTMSFAAEVLVAVASNFTEPAQEIGKIFHKKTGHTAKLSFGASGAFYNQIKNGAPFEIFLSADSARPLKLMEQGYGVESSQFTYALGTLVLYSTKSDLALNKESLKTALNNKTISHISYCNPDAAPYGKAAVETMQNLKLFDILKPKLVEGQNIAQAFQFVKTGNAEIGFVALSQVINEKNGSQWAIPQNYYSPIDQDALLLKRGEDSKAAIAFFDFLKSADATNIIRKYGYKQVVRTGLKIGSKEQ